MLFRLKGGKHNDNRGTIYKNGDVIESEADLVKTYGEKFERIGEKDPTAGKKTLKIRKNPGPETPKVEDKTSPSDEKLAARGEDVTTEFSLGKAAKGLTVHKKDGHYFVYDGEDLVNEKGATHKGVQKVVDEYLG